MSKEHQIGGWLRASEKQALDEYLRQFAIRPTAAATLLIVRELRRRRLPQLKTVYAESAGNVRRRVTAHPTDASLKQAFIEHAASVGLDPDPAASILFRAELKERWLEQALESG